MGVGICSVGCGDPVVCRCIVDAQQNVGVDVLVDWLLNVFFLCSAFFLYLGLICRDLGKWLTKNL